MSDINDFKDLRIWQKGIVIAEKCYFLTRTFPKDELYGMVQQIRRSAASIPKEGTGNREQGTAKKICTRLIIYKLYLGMKFILLPVARCPFPARSALDMGDAIQKNI
ncbi:MAG: four helix bundle protein [Xenococcaceae cyanobacterium MO_188.B29]|nr:four helix bundle protein [Xenococcaceae cyanobacterium MO_188.B29]